MNIRGLAAVAAIAAAFLCAMSYASAEWKPEYANSPPEIQEWFRTRELTPAAQKRFPFKSCCAHADVVKTKFRPSKEGADGWDYLDGETWKRVPDDIIHTDPAPGGEPIMFAVNGAPVCFFPPEGGG